MEDNNWVHDEMKSLGLDDRRIITRVTKVVTAISKAPEKSICQACGTWSEAKAAYRILNNKKLTSDLIIKSHRSQIVNRIQNQRTILAVQDTSELEYNSLNKTTGLGPYGGTEDSKGLIMHTTLAVTTQGVPLGIMEQSIWARNLDEWGKARRCRRYDIKEKESYKWLKSMDENSDGIPQNIQIVNVCDRDADIYEFYTRELPSKSLL